MRGLIVFFILIALGGVGIHGCSSAIGGSGSTPASERVIQAEPGEIVEAMNRSLQSDGMEVVSRSDSGDHYRLSLSAEEMRQHPSYARLAEQGSLTMDARVTRSQIEFAATFESGLVAGFTIDMSPAPGGSGTLARVAPLIRGTGRDQDAALTASLNRNFARFGERVLETVADAAEG